MIYYPLSTLMTAGIRDILIITNVQDRKNFERTLGDGSQFGIKITYEVQEVQRGISDAFIIGKEFIGNDRVALILGDNIFYGGDLDKVLESSVEVESGALVFGRWVPDPQRFGVVEFDKDMKALSIEEKPKNPKSNYAVVGLYFYDPDAPFQASQLKESDRGELEITDLNLRYLEMGRLNVSVLGEGVRWIDAGTFPSLLEASTFIHDEEERRREKILCPEIIALRKGFVTREQMEDWLKRNKDNEYFQGVKKAMG